MILDRLKTALGVAIFCLGASAISASAATMTTLTNNIGSDPIEVDVSIANEGAGVRMTLTINSTNTGNIADIRGVFFELAGFSDLNIYSVAGSDVTSSAFGSDAIINLGGGVNLSGGGNTNYDVGVEIGTAGIGSDDIQSTNFLVTLFGGTLTEADFMGQRIGVRATSTGAPGSARNGSSKLIGNIPTAPIVPLPASAVLLLGGIAGFGAFRLKRRTA